MCSEANGLSLCGDDKLRVVCAEDGNVDLKRSTDQEKASFSCKVYIHSEPCSFDDMLAIYVI